jgi:hypothetical protein
MNQPYLTFQASLGYDPMWLHADIDLLDKPNAGCRKGFPRVGGEFRAGYSWLPLTLWNHEWKL